MLLFFNAILKIKKHSRRRSEKGKIALIVVAEVAAKKILATMGAKCASVCYEMHLASFVLRLEVEV